MPRASSLAAVPFALIAWLAQPAASQAATISISCGAVGAELKLCREGVEAWGKKTGNQVNVVSTPNSATERLALY